MFLLWSRYRREDAERTRRLVVTLYEPGEHVVYRKQKMSTHPGPRADEIYPSASGEDYSYVVDKYWTVKRTIDEETIEVQTRRGKLHQLRVDDPVLRKATWLENLLYRKRFPTLETVPGEDGPAL